LCGNKIIIKWGFQSGRQRYKCQRCNQLFVWKNKGKSLSKQKIWFKKWILGRATLNDIAKEKKCSVSTIQRLFKKYLDNPPVPRVRENDNCHLMIDGTYSSDWCQLNYFDNDLKYLQYFDMVRYENYLDYRMGLEALKNTGLKVVSITCDGHKGLLNAISDVLPGVIVQRCVVHIVRMSIIYLRQRPKYLAAIELKEIARKLSYINNHDEKKAWIKSFLDWEQKFHYFLQEKTEHISGRNRYTHRLIRRTRSLISHAIPNLFNYLDDPNIPKSNNGLECRFSYLKNNLRIHRGLSKKHVRSFLSWYAYFKYRD
jgi:hypothetical protein